jgi:hypothetical protein
MSISIAFLQNVYMRLLLPLRVEISEAITRVRLLLFYIKYFVQLFLYSSNIEFSRIPFCVKFLLEYPMSWNQKGMAGILENMDYGFITGTIIQ